MRTPPRCYKLFVSSMLFVLGVLVMFVGNIQIFVNNSAVEPLLFVDVEYVMLVVIPGLFGIGFGCITFYDAWKGKM